MAKKKKSVSPGGGWARVRSGVAGGARRAAGWYGARRAGRVGMGVELLTAALAPALLRQVPQEYRTPTALVTALLPLLLGSRYPRELRGVSTAMAAFAAQGLSRDIGIGDFFNDSAGGLAMDGIMGLLGGGKPGAHGLFGPMVGPAGVVPSHGNELTIM